MSHSIRVAAIAAVASIVANCAIAKVPHQTAAIRVGSDSLHHLISAFLTDPVSNGEYWRSILDSAEASPNVTIVMRTAVTPWICAPASNDRFLNGILLGSFVAGNMEAQLESGTKGDQPLAGVRAVISTYAKLRSRAATFSVPAIDRWVSFDSAGALSDSIETAIRRGSSDCEV